MCVCVCEINELETVLGLNEKLIRRIHISTAGKGLGYVLFENPNIKSTSHVASILRKIWTRAS